MRLRAAAAFAAAVVACSGLAGGVAHATTPPWGPDVSSYQHPGGAAINWSDVHKQGASFGIVKATEGTYYTNGYWSGDWSGIRKAGMVRGSYEFARPALPLSTAVDQAKYLVSVTGSTRETGDLPLILDLEVTGGLNQVQLIQWAQAWVDEVRSLTGRVPIVYSYSYFWQSSMANTAAFTRYPLWIADYNGGSGPTLPLVGSWPKWTLWQYTSTATVSGIQGQVDVSHYNGTWTGLSALANGTAAPAWSVSAPAAPVSVSAAAQPKAATVTWMPAFDGGTPVTGYTVTAHPGGATVTVPGTSTSATVGGLSTTTSYYFTVTATNAKGTSAASAASNTIVPAISTSTAVLLSPGTVSYGGSGTVTVQVRRSDTGAGVPGVGVRLYTRPHSGGSWSVFGDGTTSAAGAAQFPVTPTSAQDFYAAYGGGSGYSGSASPTSTMWVAPAITISVSPRTLALGQPVTVTGAVQPASIGGSVQLQENVNGWQPLATAPVAADGSYTLAGTPVVPGASQFRVTHAAAGSFAAGSSNWVADTVTGPQAVVSGTNSQVYAWSQGTWTDLGGDTIATPSLATAQGQHYYFNVGTNQNIYVRTAGSGWKSATTTTTNCIGLTTAVSGSTLWLACLGRNHALYAATTTVPASGLPAVGKWTNLGGSWSGAPSVTVVNGQPVFAGVGGAGRLGNVYDRTVGSAWTAVPATCAGPVSAATAGTRVELACATGSTGGIQLVTGSGTSWSRQLLGGTFYGPPSVVQTATATALYVVAGNRALYVRMPTTPWENLTGWVAYGVAAG